MGQSYRDLIAWQKAMAFVMEIYRTTASFPRDEVYGLAVQMRRAVVGISSNIAQGQGRFSPGEFHLCIGRARGAVAEVETQIMIAKNLGCLASELKSCSNNRPKLERYSVVWTGPYGRRRN